MIGYDDAALFETLYKYLHHPYFTTILCASPNLAYFIMHTTLYLQSPGHTNIETRGLRDVLLLRYRRRAALHVDRPGAVRRRSHQTDRRATGVGRHCSPATDVQANGFVAGQTARTAHARTGRTQTGAHRRHQTIEMDDADGLAESVVHFI